MLKMFVPEKYGATKTACRICLHTFQFEYRRNAGNYLNILKTLNTSTHQLMLWLLFLLHFATVSPFVIATAIVVVGVAIVAQRI